MGGAWNGQDEAAGRGERRMHGSSLHGGEDRCSEEAKSGALRERVRGREREC